MILKCWDEGTRCLPFRKGAFGAAHVGKLVFVRMRERKTFPLGGRWHGEAVTDEGGNVAITAAVKKWRISNKLLLFAWDENLWYGGPSSAPVCALGHLPPRAMSST